MTVGFDPNILINYYQSKLGLGGVSASVGQTGGAAASSSSGPVKYAPTAPWSSGSGAPQAPALDKAVMAGGRFINENAAKLDLQGASNDYKKLFALYYGLDALSGLADQAAAKTTSTGDMARIQQTFTRGLAEVGDYADTVKLDQLRLTRGSTFLSDKTSVGVPVSATDYVTQTLFTGKSTDEVPAFAGRQHVGHAQRSLKAIRLLYQFMKAEIERLTDR